MPKAVRHLGANRQAGFSLISALVFSAIIGIIVMIMSQQASHAINVNANLNLDMERQWIADYLTSAVDCRQSLQSYQPASSCSNQIALRDKNGSVLVAAAGGTTVIGRWSVRALCSSSGITVQTALYKNGSAVKDPLTHAPLDWSNPSNLLYKAAATAPCAAAFGPLVPERVTLAGFVYRCPYQTHGAGGIVATPFSTARVDASTPVNFYSGTYNCPANFVPRVAWKEMDPTCSMGQSFCSCGFDAANPSQGACTSTGTNVGCGLIQYMCVAMVDGSTVPSDGTFWSH